MSQPLLDVLHGRTPAHRPVWFMRQAGRSLPEYREIRADIPMLDSCFNAELLAEITLQPVRRHNVDGAILFSDIVVPLKAAGIGVDIVPGRGPVMENPVQDRHDIANLPILDAEIGALSSGIPAILAGMDNTKTLIGFAGAPFTLASYLVEGGPSRNHEKTKALMHSDPQSWDQLMQRLVPTVVGFLQQQIQAGVQAIQLFDSWAGCLSEKDYRRFVQPYSREILQEITVPRIHFGVGTAELLTAMSEIESEAVGVDWRTPLDQAAQRFTHPRVLQGNLDPAILFAGDEIIRNEVDRICSEADAACAQGHARGHIFNLGHGVLPTTDPDTITRTVAMIHEHPAAPGADTNNLENTKIQEEG